MAIADWTFDPVKNFTPDGQNQVLGLVVHIMDGSFDGSKSWFNNPIAQASSHFGTRKDGYMEQWVDTKDRAWAQAAGNRDYLSVENEAISGESLTDGQLSRVAELFAWVHSVYGIPIQLAGGPGDSGLGWHGMGGALWGGHTSCPGDPVRAQFDEILSRAQSIVNLSQSPKPTPPPAPGLTRNLYFRRQLYMSGVDVELLQKKLNGAGANLVTDGDFGPKTLSAVKDYQQSHGLKVDGIVGPLTWASLWS